MPLQNMLGIHKFGFLVGFVGYAAALSVLQPENILEGKNERTQHIRVCVSNCVLGSFAFIKIFC